MAGVLSKCFYLIVSCALSQAVIDTMPGINNLVAMIKSRRRRDSIIIGVIIGLGFVLLLTYMF